MLAKMFLFGKKNLQMEIINCSYYYQNDFSLLAVWLGIKQTTSNKTGDKVILQYQTKRENETQGIHYCPHVSCQKTDIKGKSYIR